MLYRALREKAKIHADRIAIVGEQRSLTYGRLLHEVHNCAIFLRDLKLKPEDSLIVGIPPCPEFYVLFYAAAAIGVTVIPVSPSGKFPGQLRNLGASVAVGGTSFLKAVGNTCTGLRTTLVWNRTDGLHVPDLPGPFKRRSLIRKEQVLGVSSSGTTGEPSLSFQPAELLVRRAKLRAEVFGTMPRDVLLSTRPYSASAINADVLLPVFSGSKVVVQEKFQRLKAAQTISKEGVTVLIAAPLVFEMLASIPHTYPADFSSLRLCVSTGAPLSGSTSDKFYQRFGIRIRQRYGGTHIFPAFSYNASGITGAVGHLSGPFPMTVVDETDREAPPDTIGEMVFEVSKVKDPFWKSCLKTNPLLKGNYLYTGDLGKTDRAGNLYLVGRKSAFIKVGGNRVAPAEVEHVLRSHPQVREAVVVPLWPGQANEAVRAIVVPNGHLTTGALVRHCAQRLDGYKCPRKIEFLKSLPHNPNGKVIRHLFNTQ